MRQALACTTVAIAFVCGAALAAGQQKPPASSPMPSARVLEMRVEGEITPLTAEFVTDGIAQASQTNANLVLITMNTPGGLGDSMRDIMQKILNSPVPVAVYVTPAGSHAASAGFFILLSADIAAMAPGTNTGASTPVFSPIGAQIDEVLKRKATNDAAAYLRSIVAQRGRNVELAEKAVTEAKAFSEKEALDGRLIDLVVPSVEDLLAQLDGRKVKRFDGSTVTLQLKNPAREMLEMNRRQRLLSYIARPDVLFILFIIGLLGLYAEFSHPGLIVPGVVGAVAMVLALVAMQILPINMIGVLLIILAIGLFVLEAKVTSYGLLGLAGVVSMVVGALLLINSPLTGAGVSLGTALGATIPFALLSVFLMTLILRSYKWKYAVGVEALVGQTGEVTEAIDGRGMVFVGGELWRAAARDKIPRGARIRVVKVDGLTVRVEPVEPQPETKNQ